MLRWPLRSEFELETLSTAPKLRSFPRKRESRAISAFTRVFDALWGWVPGFAGTSGTVPVSVARMERQRSPAAASCLLPAAAAVPPRGDRAGVEESRPRQAA